MDQEVARTYSNTLVGSRPTCSARMGTQVTTKPHKRAYANIYQCRALLKNQKNIFYTCLTQETQKQDYMMSYQSM